MSGSRIGQRQQSIDNVCLTTTCRRRRRFVPIIVNIILVMFLDLMVVQLNLEVWTSAIAQFLVVTMRHDGVVRSGHTTSTNELILCGWVCY
jgi:hypothetical protein